MSISRHHACDDFQHTAAITRRQMLGRAAALGLTLYTANALPLGRALDQAAEAAAAAPDAPVLVSVFLPGGADLMDTLVPLAQEGAYRDLRGPVAVQADALGATGLGLHPALSRGLGGGVRGLFDAGKIGFLPGIDYANPDLSHFHSRHFWETGLITQKGSPGWLGRFLDVAGNRDNAFQGVTAGYTLSPVVATAGAPVASFDSPSSVDLSMQGVGGADLARAQASFGRLVAAGNAPGPVAVTRSVRLAQGVAETLRPFRATAAGDPLVGSVPYPANSAFARRLSSLAALIAQPLGIRVASVAADGNFDTHDNQATVLDAGLGAVSQALAAFQADLEARGVADRVLTFVWSEFGRRPKANDSGGTDHGAGGLAWVQGTRAAPGVLTDYPSLAALDAQKNLQVTVDFRRVYASLLESWLQTPADAVIPQSAAFGRLALVR